MADIARTSLLAALPEEVLGQVSQYLDSDGFFALRRCCREIESKTFTDFALKYFKRKCFMFTTESLQTFVNIAESRFASFLKVVALLTIGFTWTLTVPSPNDPSNLSGCPRSQDCRAAHAEFWEDQMRLHRLGRKPGGDGYLLRRAFKHLKSLVWLGFVDDVLSLEDKMICHGFNKWSRKLRHSMAHWPVHHVNLSSSQRTGCAWLTHVWRTTLTAVAKSGIAIKHFETAFSKCKFSLLPSRDFKFHPRIISKLTQCFDEVESFAIEFRTALNWSEIPPPSYTVTHKTSDSIDYARKFAGAFANAKNLSLCSDARPLSGPTCVAIVQQFELQKLTEFHLATISIDYGDLATILCHLNLAHTINLRHINLQTGTWSSILKVLSKLPRLNHLHLIFLRQEGNPTYFLPPSKSGYRSRCRHGFLMHHPSSQPLPQDWGNYPSNQPLPATLPQDWENLEVEWPTAASVIEETTSADPTLRTLKVRPPRSLGWPRPGAAAPQGSLKWNPPTMLCPERYPMFMPPGNAYRGWSGRGSYVCLSGWEIGACLPRMIKKCYVAPRDTHGGLPLPFPDTNNPNWFAVAVSQFPGTDAGAPLPFHGADVLENFDFDAFFQGANNNFTGTWPPPSPSEADTVPPESLAAPANGAPTVAPWTGNAVPAQGIAISPTPSSPAGAAAQFDWNPSNGGLVGGGDGPMTIPTQADTVPPPGWQPPMASGALGMNTMQPPPQQPALFGPSTIPTHAPLFLQANPDMAVPMPFNPMSLSLLPTDKSLEHLDLAIAPPPLDDLQWPHRPPTIHSKIPEEDASKSASSTIFPRKLHCAQLRLRKLQQGRLWRREQSGEVKRESKGFNLNIRLRFDRHPRRQLFLTEASPSTIPDTDDKATPTHKIHPPLTLPLTPFSCALTFMPARNRSFWAHFFSWPRSPPPAPPAPLITAKDRFKAKRLAKSHPGKKYMRYRKEVLTREKKARSPWSPASLSSEAQIINFGKPLDCQSYFTHIVQQMTRGEEGNSLDHALERIRLEIRLQYNQHTALRSNARDQTYLRLEKDFGDCGGLLGPSDFLDGADEEDGADVVEDDCIQGSDESAQVNGSGGNYDDETIAVILSGAAFPLA